MPEYLPGGVHQRHTAIAVDADILDQLDVGIELTELARMVDTDSSIRFRRDLVPERRTAATAALCPNRPSNETFGRLSELGDVLRSRP